MIPPNFPTQWTVRDGYCKGSTLTLEISNNGKNFHTALTTETEKLIITGENFGQFFYGIYRFEYPNSLGKLHVVVGGTTFWFGSDDRHGCITGHFEGFSHAFGQCDACISQRNINWISPEATIGSFPAEVWMTEKELQRT